MASRLILQTKLEDILGNRNVYFNPPSSVNMNYPAIVYSRRPSTILHANNEMYKNFKVYELTVIDEDPDSEIVDKILELPYCSHIQHFVSDNLVHDVFTLYF